MLQASAQATKSAQANQGRKIPPRVVAPQHQRSDTQNFWQPTTDGSHTVPIQQSDSWRQGPSSRSPAADQQHVQHSWTPQSSSSEWPDDSGHVQAMQWPNTDGWRTQSLAESSSSSTGWIAANWQGENLGNQSGSSGVGARRREQKAKAVERGERNPHTDPVYNAQRHLINAFAVHGEDSWQAMDAHNKYLHYKTLELMHNAESNDEDYYRYMAFLDMAEIVVRRA